jgi:hypothetical protein
VAAPDSARPGVHCGSQTERPQAWCVEGVQSLPSLKNGRDSGFSGRGGG